MITKKGTIIAAKMKNTVTVSVNRLVFHPIYKKAFPVTKKFLADTNGFDVGMGDEVVITECRPLSKRKRFKVTEIVKSAPRLSEMAVEKGVEEILNKAPAADEAATPSVS